MSLTRNQIHERFRDLSGEIKAAHTAIADCAADCEAKDKMAEIARQALDKANANLAALHEERSRLAQAYAEQAMTVGDDAAQELDTSVWGNSTPLVKGPDPLVEGAEWPNAYTNGVGEVDIEDVLDPDFTSGLNPIEYLEALHEGKLG